MLNPQQQAAVESYLNEDAQVIAGAGSGKTTVLTHRIAYLVQNGVPPWKITAVTFTNKAAQEMRTRLFDLLGEDAAKRIQMGTFHALGRKILLRYREEMGLPKTLSILDRKEQEGLLLRVVQGIYGENSSRAMEKRMGDARKTPENKKRLQLQKSKEKELAGYALRRIGGWKQAGKYPPPDPIPTGLRPDVRQAIEVYAQYEKEKDRLGMFDFDDLITRVNMLFQDRPDILQKERERIQHLLVDEFQDVNAEQVRWISALAGKAGEGKAKLFLVGDEDQSIYGWRGSRPDLLRAFGREREMPVYLLEHNYRSSPVILHAANAVIQNNPDRENKNLRTTREDQIPIGVFCGKDEGEEKQWVADQVEFLVRQQQGSPASIAVLYRAKSAAQGVYRELVSRGIPCQMVGDTSFQETAEVRDAIAWLRFLDNPHQDAALLRALQHPPCGIGPKVLGTIEEEAELRGVSVWDALHQIPATPAIEAFLRKTQKLQENRSELPFPDFVESVLHRPTLLDKGTQKPSLWEWIAEQDNGENRIANLNTLVQAAKNQEERWAESCLSGEEPGQEREEENDPLQEFLSQVALAGADGEEPEGVPQVSFLTIHKAKGLEYPVVFVVGCNEGVFPSRKEQDPFEECENLEEERRLFYVAVTRAKHALLLTGASFRRTFGGYEGEYPMTGFLQEIPKELLETQSPEKVLREAPKEALLEKDSFLMKKPAGKKQTMEPEAFMEEAWEPAEVALDLRGPDLEEMPEYLEVIPFLESCDPAEMPAESDWEVLAE